MKKYSISDIESLIGIKAQTLRAWETRYNLVPPKRTSTNIRYYDSEDLKMLLNIVKLNENGYKISRIAQLNNEQVLDLVVQLNSSWENETVQLLNLSKATLRYNEKTFSAILSGCIKAMGLVKTMDTVLFPFMKRIGMLWQTGTIDPSQEHFAANLIRDRIIVEIDKVKKPKLEKPLRFVLFLPEGEVHETGLLFARYLLKKCGHDSLYLGAEVPYKDIKKLSLSYKPDYMFIVLTSLKLGKNMNKIIAKVMDHVDVPVLAGGSLLTEFDVLINDRLTPLKNVCQMVDFLEEL